MSNYTYTYADYQQAVSNVHKALQEVRDCKQNRIFGPRLQDAQKRLHDAQFTRAGIADKLKGDPRVQ